MKKKAVLLTLATTMAFTSAIPSFAHDRDRRHGREVFDRDYDHKVCDNVHRNRPPKPSKPPKPSNKPPVRTLQCGDTVTESMTLANDLICPNVTGFALNIIGDGIVFNGGGHKIEAPNAGAGLFVNGDSVTVMGTRVNGVEEGYGILAYDSENVKIFMNDFSENMIGIMVYAEQKQIQNVNVIGNDTSRNSIFGIRTGYDGVGTITSPNIQFNKATDSGSYAIFIKAENYTLEGVDGNLINGSNSGYYLTHGAFKIQNIVMRNMDIERIQIFIDSASDVKVSNIDVSTLLPRSVNQDRIGIDLYRVAKFSISNVLAQNNDAGIKFETELGANPQGTVQNCVFSNNSVAGILVESYDGTPYGALKFVRNVYREAANAYNVLIGSATQIGLGSII